MQKLVVPFEMRGYQGVYNLERRVSSVLVGISSSSYFHLLLVLITLESALLAISQIYDGAVRGLSPVQGPLPVKFPLPDPRDPFSLKPGSLTFAASKSTLQKSASVTAAIAGARAAATQFSKKDHKAATSSETGTQEQSWGSNGDSSSVDGNVPSIVHGGSAYLQNQNQPSIFQSTPAYSQNPNSEPRRSPRLEFGASNRVSIDMFSFIYFCLVNLFFLAVLILFLKNKLTCLVLPPFQIISRFGFSRYIALPYI